MFVFFHNELIITSRFVDVNVFISSPDLDMYVEPWICVRISMEQYILRYESRYLREFGRAILYLLSLAFSLATHEILKYTAFNGRPAVSVWGLHQLLFGIAQI